MSSRRLPKLVRLERAEKVAEKFWILASARSLKDFNKYYSRYHGAEQLLQATEQLTDPASRLLGQEHALLKSLVSSGRVDFTPQEQSVFDAADDFLRISLTKQDQNLD